MVQQKQQQQQLYLSILVTRKCFYTWVLTSVLLAGIVFFLFKLMVNIVTKVLHFPQVVKEYLIYFSSNRVENWLKLNLTSQSGLPQLISYSLLNSERKCRVRRQIVIRKSQPWLERNGEPWPIKTKRNTSSWRQLLRRSTKLPWKSGERRLVERWKVML